MTAEEREKRREKALGQIREFVNSIARLILLAMVLGVLWAVVSVIRLMWNHSLF
jgi:hypothetical protein